MIHTKIGALIAAALLGNGCAQEAPDADSSSALGPGRVAIVNGTPIQESIFRLYALNGLQKNAEDLSDEERALVLDDLIRFRVLADAAKQRGIPTERKVAAELELQRLQLIARITAGRYLEEHPATEAELRAAYNDNLEQFEATQFKARHILVSSEEDAAALISELDQGADFVELARENSTGPTAPQGGDLGWFSADSMVAPFADAVRTMQPGDHSATPVQTQFGWHVILLEESSDQQLPGLEAVRSELVTAVDRKKLEAYIEELKQAAEVVEQDQSSSR
jgi:peptidyl-prolyl cis-trans isomerase C